MGVKTIKDHYQIEHIVQRVTGDDRYGGGDVICIGSAYIHNIIVIDAEGRIVKGRNEVIRGNDALERYRQELIADEGPTLKALVHAQDIHGLTTPVWIVGDGRLYAKRCEGYPGWPNTTTDGQIMYENTTFLDRREAIACLKNNTHLAVKMLTEDIWRDVKEEARRLRRRLRRLARYVGLYIKARVRP